MIRMHQSFALGNSHQRMLWSSAAAAAAAANTSAYSSYYYNNSNSSSRSFSSSSFDEEEETTTIKSSSQFWGYNKTTGRAQRPIFVAATKQHVGKTTTSLALMSGLQKRFEKVGFIKPVGQQHVAVKGTTTEDDDERMIRVDKDVVLMRDHFGLNHIDYQDMSPVIIPQGYTRDFVDGKIDFSDQVASVMDSMGRIAANSDAVLIEGTGHCAVGSIVGLNNAKVASLLGADMVLIANGGLGKAFDELELNRILCQHYGVRIAGVIVNKVIPDKYEQTKDYMSRAMMKAWGVPLLGCIPDRPFLGCPALADLETLFDTKMLSGQEHRFRHYNVDDINVVTTSLTRFLENLREKPSRTLYICHVTRDDLIVGFLGEYLRSQNSTNNNGGDDSNNSRPFEAALLVCGRKKKYNLSKEVREMLTGVEGCPVMVVEKATHDAMTSIHTFTPKLNIDDTNRVNVAVDHYEPYIDFDELARRTTSSDSSFNEPGAPPLDQLRRL
eukprot:scaffold4973_cov135-Cylindrotheca_fusiformis.AAC.20